MKTKIYLVVLAFLSLSNFYAQVGIGTTTPDASAILDVEATDKGLLPPRMNTNQRDAIQNPSDGLLIYNTTTGSLNYYNQGWFEMKGSALEGLVECNTINIGKLEGDTPASGVVSKVVYAGSNGTPYDGLTIQSTGVTGLTATLSSGTFNTSGGELEFAISGTPDGVAGGEAIFAISVGGQSCFHKRVVDPKFVCGQSTVTTLYNNIPITYGTTVGPNNNCWLDRNLGATEKFDSSTDQIDVASSPSFGGLYQWGRSDDGHQKGVYALDGNGVDMNFNSDLAHSTDRSTTYFPSNPATVTPTDSNKSNWFVFSDFNVSVQDILDDLADLWYNPDTSVVGPSNPCPDGWRVPLYAEMDDFNNNGTETSLPKFEIQPGTISNSYRIGVFTISGAMTYHVADKPIESTTAAGSGQDKIRVIHYGPPPSQSGLPPMEKTTRAAALIRCIKI